MEHDMQDFTAEVRRFLDAHVAKAPDRTAFTWGEGDDSMAYFSSLPPEEEREHVQRARDWQRIRHENGFGWITGPPEYGGRGLTPVHDLLYDAIESEYDVADTGTLSVIGLGMIGPTILAHAQPRIKDRWLPAMYRGDAIACQLFSEPGAGSDLASVATKAVRDGEDWVLNGQKVWTSVAQHSQIGLALTRTNPDAPKHRGITAFLVPMDAPGVEVRPLRQMTGGADFNEVFLTDVRVPEDHRLGEIDGGWTVALTTLMNERATVGSEGAGPVAAALSPDRLSALMRATWTWDDRALRARLAELLVDAMATEHLNTRALRTLRAGVTPGPERSVAKLMYGQNLTRAAHFVADCLGPRLVADTGKWGTYAWSELLLATPALRILGGTEEIMKNILAERVLGLPKEARA
ncbi:alkylation response protein AidB-like acyl-CoA dehydrogenase [Streptomyces umbrinus]|uniref:Alkylation response protein AidB-like acyl-CoA dehydrogenase n=1 Tax=Streptomyces umbrinus TaxID=67370 RepID=A0ABU0SJE9_9ACTN|nr:acyl-CoA dehydrogenase family protein [Streptomyces umbrinus]MDQ1023392.1 alkylation response protein AidB-like acyl-CoA dehydrogenase [Streptomyces umbrinus]